MSVLSLPRIILNGSTSWNPATNNNSLANAYNKDPVAIKLPDGVTYDTLDEWLIEFDDGTTNGSWNVYGQMQANLDAEVVGVKTTQADDEDKILGSSLVFQGGTPDLVDVNPYSSVSSQIFFSDFGVGSDSEIGFSGPGSCRMTSRRPFMTRNTAGLAIAGNMGVVWQTTIAKADIQWGSDFGSSTVLGELHDAMSRPEVLGVMLRMSSFTTIYFTSIVEGGVTTPGNGTPEIEAAYRKLADCWAALQPVGPNNVAEAFNPAVSSLVGVVGLWEAGELATVATERVLAIGAGPLGPAQAKVHPSGSLSLDLLNTFPEDGAESEKANVGSYAVVARADDGTTSPITILKPDDYSKSAYDAGGGILDIDCPDSSLQTLRSGRIEFLALNGPGKMGGVAAEPALSQLSLYADTDQRSVYLNQDDQSTVEVRVYENGSRPTKATKVLISPYYPPQQGPAEGTWCLVSDDETSCPKNVELSGGSVQPDGLIVDVDDEGAAQFSIAACRPGNAFVTFLPFFADDAPPTPPARLPISQVSTTGYTAVRVLPFDDALASTPEEEVTWDFVYDRVLRAFDLVYRGMSAGVFSLGDEEMVREHASGIIALTDPDKFETPSYMPVTRDLSRGKRDLLVRFLKKDPDTT